MDIQLKFQLNNAPTWIGSPKTWHWNWNSMNQFNSNQIRELLTRTPAWIKKWKLVHALFGIVCNWLTTRNCLQQYLRRTIAYSREQWSYLITIGLWIRQLNCNDMKRSNNFILASPTCTPNIYLVMYLSISMHAKIKWQSSCGFVLHACFQDKSNHSWYDRGKD